MVSREESQDFVIYLPLTDGRVSFPLKQITNVRQIKIQRCYSLSMSYSDIPSLIIPNIICNMDIAPHNLMFSICDTEPYITGPVIDVYTVFQGDTYKTITYNFDNLITINGSMILELRDGYTNSLVHNATILDGIMVIKINYVCVD